ncbi:MFS general substrate transporter [Xylariaceae sp. FL0594]|nr:MFS general substrate transporter [Xylariaceae sp. FL0594]
MAFQAIAPSFWGPLSDAKGRRIAYIYTFLVFLGACLGLAETRSLPMLVVFRSLQSTGSASTIAIGAAVIGDITTREDRGGFIGIFQAGLLAPVAVGPVIGGALAGSLGWRSIFWFLALCAGVFLLFLVLVLPETLRLVVANGSASPSSPIAKYPLKLYQKTTKIEFTAQAAPPRSAGTARVDIVGPLRILFSKQAAPIIVFLALYYAVWQMSIAAMADLFLSRYGLSETEVGLTFIANGAGSIIGTLVMGRILDADYRRVKCDYERRDMLSQPVPSSSGAGADGDSGNERQEAQRQRNYDHVEFPLEKARLRLLPLLALLQCASVLVFGWTMHYPERVGVAVPAATTFVTGGALVSAQSAVQTYLVDLFPGRPAAATASLNLARCLLGAGAISAVMSAVAAIGVGATFTAAVGLQVLALVGVAVQWRCGGRWRRVEAADNEKRGLQC